MEKKSLRHNVAVIESRDTDNSEIVYNISCLKMIGRDRNDNHQFQFKNPDKDTITEYDIEKSSSDPKIVRMTYTFPNTSFPDSVQ